MILVCVPSGRIVRRTTDMKFLNYRYIQKIGWTHSIVSLYIFFIDSDVCVERKQMQLCVVTMWVCSLVLLCSLNLFLLFRSDHEIAVFSGLAIVDS